jgi:hypothetical protein
MRIGGYVLALVVGAGAALALASSSDSGTQTDTRTVTATKTVVRTRTVTKAAKAPPRTALPDGAAKKVPTTPAPPASVPNKPDTAKGPAQTFSGTGSRTLGSITVRRVGATLRWINSDGQFRLLFNNGGVAVNSSEASGEIGVPTGTYSQVKVQSPGRWTIRIR